MTTQLLASLVAVALISFGVGALAQTTTTTRTVKPDGTVVETTQTTANPPASYSTGPQIYGPAGVRGQARRVSRRTSRRVSRRN